MRFFTHLLGLLALSSLLLACGAASEPPRAPEAPSSMATGDESFASVDDAQRGLKQAEADLRAALGPADARAGAAPAGPSAETSVAGAAPAPAQPSPAPPAPATGASDAPAKTPQREAQSQDASPCATACRALGSMTKATETICRLAGMSDERCTKAQHSVDEARSSMRTCVCVSAR